MADIDIDDRSEALEAFAKAGANAQPLATMPAAGVLAGGAGERVVGAQRIAVPRDEAKVLHKLKLLAAAAGEEWYYRWQVTEKKTGKKTWVEGPTIKCANEVGRLFGNCEVEERVVDLGDSWLIYARFTDYETGYSLTRPFQQRKSQRTMGDDADRQRDIAFQIGTSKAIRNVVCNALQTFADYAFKEARGALVDKIGRDLEKWREATVRKIEAKIDIKRVEAVLGRQAEDWLAPDVAMAIAMMKGVSDGMQTMDETFPPLAAAAPDKEPGATLDQFANTDSGAGQTAENPPPAGPQPPAPDAAAGDGDPPRSSPAAN